MVTRLLATIAMVYTFQKPDVLFAEVPGDLVCEDLYQAACFKADGSPKFEGALKKTVAELNKPVKAARDQAVRSFGFNNYDEALKAELKNAGIDLVADPDERTWKSLKRELTGPNTGGQAGKPRGFFSAVEACQKSFAESKTSEEIKATSKKNLDLVIVFAARDIPNFINHHVMSKCSRLKNAPSVYTAELNSEVARVCSQPLALQQKGIQLFRQEGSGGYKEEAEKFVRSYWLPELQQKSANNNNNGVGDHSAICTTLQNTLQSAASRVAEDFVLEINKSKIVIESLIEEHYSEKKKVLATKIFQESKQDISSLLNQVVHDSKKRADLQEEYNRMELFWMKRPESSLYKKNARGLEVLDESKNPTRVVSEAENDAFWVFMDDPTLTYFTSFDANYYPDMSFGKTKIAEKIQIRPGALSSVEKNPEAYRLILSHEAGHKAAPKMSLANGHDLTPEFQKLQQCFQSHRSIRLQRNQIDEAFADYISAEVLGRRLSAMPSNQRRSALIHSLESLCPKGEDIAHTVSIYCKGSHPEDSLRVSGIFGANPLIREAIGCTAESSKFKSCGFKPVVSNSNPVSDQKSDFEKEKAKEEAGMR